jgi:hypothetical protein
MFGQSYSFSALAIPLRDLARIPTRRELDDAFGSLNNQGDFMTKKKPRVRIDPKRSKPKRKTGKGKSIKKSRR